MIESYRNLIVWQKSIELVKLIYQMTRDFPKEEAYGLTSQMRRAAVSIPSNIAEGSRRGSRKDFRSFLLNAFGSGAELETQVVIAKKLSLGKNMDYGEIDDILNEIMRMLNTMTRELKSE